MGSRFTDKYDRNSFMQFLNSFLPPEYSEYREVREFNNRALRIVDKAYILGECESLGGLKVIEVHHDKLNDPRVKLASEAFRLMAETFTQRALVVFVNEKSDQWRLSFMTIDFEYDKSKNKILDKPSNPKRYSFVLGPGAKTVTPYQYLVQKGAVRDLDDLRKRFSVEVVNNEFYKEIARLYDELIGTDKISRQLIYTTTGDESHEFAVRLIGRIIFCWFLREKKSMSGVPLIPTQILSRHAADQPKYYLSVLAPLFFEVLNKPLQSRVENFRKDGYEKIPYLNGGLFNNDEIDRYRFDNQLQMTNVGPSYADVPNSWLHQLFDLLERFNFTVDENTSFDTDLSIDPEMLGRVFENLLARINPETGETVRKSTGSFYTPREIVDHMIDASLTEYLTSNTTVSRKKLGSLVSYDLLDDAGNELENSEAEQVLEALSSLTVLDPACGSGAFPIGMLQKIVFIISILDPDAKWWLSKQLEGASPELRREFENKSINYIRKLGIIRQTIFGVDIQPIATEISRLRCFLTLVVDEAIDDNDPNNRGIRPLPNLDFKFVTANTLIKLNDPSDHRVQLFEDSQGLEELSNIMTEYFSAPSKDRDGIKYHFSQTQKKIFERLLGHKDVSVNTNTYKLSSWDPFEHAPSEWFDPKWMFGIENGFDIVIGNPPYFVYQGHIKDEIPRIKTIDLYKRAQGGKLNAYKLFLAFAPSVLKPGGLVSFIFQNSFLADSSAKKIRQYYLHDQQIITIDSFPERDNVHKRVFESVKMSVCVMLAKNSSSDQHMPFTLNVWADKKRSQGYTTSFTPNELSDFDPVALPIPYLKSEEKAIFSKCYSLRHANVISCYEGELNMTFHRDYFTQDSSNPKVIKGAQVQRYYLTDHLSQGQLEYVNATKYLDDYSNSKKSKSHESSRIVMQGITGVDDERRLVMSILSSGMYCANSCNYILVNDGDYTEDFVLGLYNSRLFNWLFKKTSTNSNVNCYEVENLPIPKIIGKEKLVNEISKASQRLGTLYERNGKQKTPGEITELDNEIDRLVYQLYDLTSDEIQIIERPTR